VESRSEWPGGPILVQKFFENFLKKFSEIEQISQKSAEWGTKWLIPIYNINIWVLREEA